MKMALLSSQTARDSPRGRWLSQHRAGERALAKAIGPFLRAQARRVATAARGHRSLSAEDAGKLIDIRREHRLFMRAIETPLVRLVIAGAGKELAAVRSDRRKAMSLAGHAHRLPSAVESGITSFLAEVEKQYYWVAVHKTTRAAIFRQIRDGLDANETVDQIADRIQRHLKDGSLFRAQMIARTETTGALNAGKSTIFRSIVDDADSPSAYRNLWLTLRDGHQRDTHDALHRVAVAVGKDFDVGGNPAPFPGHFSLPAEERISCRCTISLVMAS
jgi:hypothetical protein